MHSKLVRDYQSQHFLNNMLNLKEESFFFSFDKFKMEDMPPGYKYHLPDQFIPPQVVSTSKPPKAYPAYWKTISQLKWAKLLSFSVKTNDITCKSTHLRVQRIYKACFLKVCLRCEDQ